LDAPRSGRQKTSSDEAHFDQFEDLLEESKSWSVREHTLRMGIPYPSFEPLETQLDIEIRILNDEATFNGVTKLPEVRQRAVSNEGDYWLLFSNKLFFISQTLNKIFKRSPPELFFQTNISLKANSLEIIDLLHENKF
jgi:hypothetical protein